MMFIISITLAYFIIRLILKLIDLIWENFHREQYYIGKTKKHNDHIYVFMRQDKLRIKFWADLTCAIDMQALISLYPQADTKDIAARLSAMNTYRKEHDPTREAYIDGTAKLAELFRIWKKQLTEPKCPSWIRKLMDLMIELTTDVPQPPIPMVDQHPAEVIQQIPVSEVPPEEPAAEPKKKSGGDGTTSTLPFAPAQIVDRVGTPEQVEAARAAARDNIKVTIDRVDPKSTGATCHYSLVGPVQHPPLFFDRHNPRNFELGALTRLAAPVPEHTIDIATDPYWAQALEALKQRIPILTGGSYKPCASRLYGWLNGTSYGKKRRARLARDAVEVISAEDVPALKALLRRLKTSCFIKDEPYAMDDRWRPRLIISRDERYKEIYGPFFKPVENVFFSLPQTVKHIPNRDRPRHITEHLMKAAVTYKDPVFVSIDYSSFESCQDKHMMLNGEWKIYEHAWEGAKDPVFRALREYATSAVLARDPAKNLSIQIQPMRFSGDMNTSLGNSIHNWLAIYAAQLSVGAVPGAFVCEGDDALVCIDRSHYDAFQHYLEGIGFRLKIDVHDDPGMAGFCHVWWRGDVVVTEPTHRLRNVPFSSNKNDPEGQLNARGISMAAEWGSCPVLCAVARVLTQGEGRMRWNTWAAEALSLNGIKYHVTDDVIHIEPIEVGRYIRPPSEEARALIADLNPEWPRDRQIYVEENLNIYNFAELLGF